MVGPMNRLPSAKPPTNKVTSTVEPLSLPAVFCDYAEAHMNGLMTLRARNNPEAGEARDDVEL